MPASAPTIDAYFDCSSPWTYLGFHGLIPLAERLGAEIAWKPILVGGVFNAVNPSVYEARKAPVKAKARYHAKGLQDWAKLAGLNIKMPPSVFPVNSVKVMRACILLEPQGKLVDFARTAFEFYWSEDRDISQDDVIAKICARAGVDAAHVADAIKAPAIKDQLRANTEALINRGGFGSPTFFVDDSMFFGNDRLVLVEDAVNRAKSAA
ncbi:MAG: 2-hydroxychromene-2-carboxylate isomerase [Pseudomonadota bacterium]